MESHTIPGPSSPGVWHSAQVVFNFLGYSEKCREKYGDVFQLNALGSPSVVCSDPEDVKTIHTQKMEAFDFRSPNLVLGSLLGEQSLLMMEGVPHRELKKDMLRHFHSMLSDKLEPRVQECVAEKFDRCFVGAEGELTAHEWTKQVTLRVIIDLLFGEDDPSLNDEVETKVSNLLELMNEKFVTACLLIPALQLHRLAFGSWRRYLSARGEVSELLRRSIQLAKSDESLFKGTLFRFLVEEYTALGEEEQIASVQSQLMTLLFTGHETTANAAGFGVFHVLRDPELKGQIRETGQRKSLAELLADPYLDSVCREVLRLYLPSLFTLPRVTKAPFQLRNYRVPSGVTLMASNYLVHRREDIYENPLAFVPDRFCGKQFGPFEYFPFGFGVRSCLGTTLATLELKLILTHAALQNHVALSDLQTPKLARRGFTFGPENRVPLKMCSSAFG